MVGEIDGDGKGEAAEASGVGVVEAIGVSDGVGNGLGDPPVTSEGKEDVGVGNGPLMLER
jgi:hypothetical protein